MPPKRANRHNGGQGGRPSSGVTGGATSMRGGTTQGMRWPPVIKNFEVYGEVKDLNRRLLPRDQGRSIQLGGHTYYVFGDTFCHDDRNDFCGTTDNTVAFIPNLSRPTQCKYLSNQPRVPQYIPSTPSERAFTEHPQNRKINRRMVIWSFGGVVEDQHESGTGWIFFDKLITTGPECSKFLGIGVARVSLKNGNHIQVDRVCGDDVLWSGDDPKFGSTSTLIDDDGWVYLLGNNDRPKAWDFRNHWARIRRDADFTNRNNYQFLLKPGQWSSELKSETLKNVMPVQTQGAILKLPDFAPRGKPYMWIGVNKFLGNRMYIACAANIAGPWNVVEQLELPKMLGEQSKTRYCLYPHPWGGDLSKGQMLVSWTDDGLLGGRVFSAMITFEMMGEPVQIYYPGQSDSNSEIPQKDWVAQSMVTLKEKLKSLVGNGGSF